MTKRFPEQAERFATMPVLSSDAVTDRWLWNLSMLMREIAESSMGHNQSPIMEVNNDGGTPDAK